MRILRVRFLTCSDLAHLVTHIADALHTLAPASGRSAAESDARLLVLVIPPSVRDEYASCKFSCIG